MKTFQLKFMKNNSLVRWLKLLDKFEKKTTCTLGELSKVTNSSSRTLISDIANIRNYFHGTIEISSSKVGFFLKRLMGKLIEEKNKI